MASACIGQAHSPGTGPGAATGSRQASQSLVSVAMEQVAVVYPSLATLRCVHRSPPDLTTVFEGLKWLKRLKWLPEWWKRANVPHHTNHTDLKLPRRLSKVDPCSGCY